MAARRGKTQAKRNQGNGGGLPGWAWMVLGILLAVVVILVAPKYLKSGGDGFFRPQPNPDARPAAVSSGEDDAIASDGDSREPADKPKRGNGDKKDTDYDFYTLLPGKEVPMSDAELAASEQAEAKREAAQQKANKADDAAADKADSKTVASLPKPVETAPAATPATAPTSADTTPAAAATTASAATPAAAAVDDGTRYLLQAGAFQASGQAEEMKAKIALLGLSARVESASIKGSTVYRVRMGPYGTASDLADAKRKLASGGLPAMAIKVK
ncbi:SPOR domain-containing protein [Lysobacter sp. S4-A87]|uniref:SPOR domain-containing protein n=1 Tax=Lysobacter sp. S4-A87 TaxID=2925843 RepID=UPI001F53B564|nr:SPOR domain-containing protein [Lysobacter sp. S4-A87]UNK48106.1 SPOR domain-containing protein [Lysobacter sp. S4-A87]